MADRSVVVRLRAEVGQYIAGLKQAAKSTTDFGREVTGHGKKASADIERIGTVSVIAGAAITAAFAKAAFTAANFEKEMSGVRAVSGASADEMKRLEDAALAAGASVKLAGVTASDAARAEAELVKAGVGVSDVLGGALMGSLTLAAAGQLDFADAATIAAQAMNIFDLSGSDVTHIADLLAAAANKSAGDVSGFGDALRQGGLVAEQTGLSLEETVGALAAFADNALIGSDAGTSLKTMFQRLTPQSVEAAALMKELGFSAYDAQGNFIGLDGLAGELESSLGGLTNEQRNSAMATLFGSDAVRGANILYEEGASGINKYIRAVDDEGAAARMAAIQNDNLKGDIEALGGALESALIENGSKATDALRAITGGATDMVGGFSAMPDTLQTVAMGLGAIVGATSLIGGGFISLAPKITASTDALKDMDSSVANFAGNNLGKISAGLAGIGTALAVGVYVYGQATAASRQYKDEVDALATALEPVTEGQADLNTELENFLKAQAEGLSDVQIGGLNALGVSIGEIRRAVAQGEDALDPLRDAVKKLGIDLKGVDLGDLNEEDLNSEAVANFAAATGMAMDEAIAFIDELENWDDAAQEAARRSMDAAVANDAFTQSAVDAAVEANTAKDGTVNWVGALKDLAPKVEDTGDAAGTAAGGIGDMTQAEQDAEEAAKDLQEAIENLLRPLDTRAAADQFSSGINDMAEHFADADEQLADAKENMQDRKEDLEELLATPADERGEGWAGRVRDAKDAIVEAQARIDEALAGTSRSLEGNSEAALANRDMLDQMARDGVAAIEAMAADETLSIEEVMWNRGVMIGQMEAEATRLGLNKEAVEFYTEALGNVPVGDIKTNLELSVATTYAEKVAAGTARLAVATGGLIPDPVYMASGGWSHGPRGTDTVPAWLTPGEFVVTAQAASRFGIGNLERINDGMMSAGSAGASYDNSRRIDLVQNFHGSTRHQAPRADFAARRLALEMV